MATALKLHRWSATPRNGRRFSSTAWRWAVSFDLVDPATGRPLSVKTERGYARTKRAARRAVAKACD